MKKKVTISFFIGLFVIFFVIYIVNFPLQKIKAEKAFENYLKEQEVPESLILYKDIMKDTQLNGYGIYVQFKDDPQILYCYTYVPKSPSLRHNIHVLGYFLENEQKIERPYGGTSVEADVLKHKLLE